MLDLDFDELDAINDAEDAGTWVAINRPDGVALTFATGETNEDGEEDRVAFEMRIAGSHSKHYRDALTTEKKQRKGKKFADDDEAVQESLLRVNAACVLEWRGLHSKGTPVPFSKGNVLALLRDPKRDWIYAQVQKAIHEHARFFVTASAS